jgi:predicted amidohydrolase
MAVNDRKLHLPRILCLHGGGTNARIFKAQCRRIIAQLDTEFRFFFAEAAFLSDAGSDVLLVYSQWGPFKRWLRWLSEHLSVSPAIVAAKLE